MAHLYLRRLQASDATECGLDFGTAELNATCCDGLLDVPAPPISATFIIIAVVLVILSGLFSGLNLGLMSFTDDDLGIIIDGSSDEREKRYARRIRPLRKRGNLLLCTLLLGNTLVNALIAILLADVASGTLGAIVTTGLIVIFGEITPQSVCSRHALVVGYYSLPLVFLFVIVCFPVAFPISIVLDKLLGREISGVFSRQMLVSLINLNVNDPEHAKETDLTANDARLLRGALTYKDRKVGDVMTPLANVFSVSEDASLDRAAFLAILRHGHTRIPVHRVGAKSEITALLFAKDLLGIGFERKIPLRDVLASFDAERRVQAVPSSMALNEALELVKRSRVHMVLVHDMEGKTVGIATLEDFIEEILGEEIVDETDVYVNVAEASSNSVESTPGTTPDGRAHGRTLSGDGSGPRAAKTGSGGIPHHPTPSPHSGRPGSRPGSRSGPHSGRPGLANQNSRRYDTTELLRSLGSIDYDTARRSMADDVADGTVVPPEAARERAGSGTSSAGASALPSVREVSATRTSSDG